MMLSAIEYKKVISIVSDTWCLLVKQIVASASVIKKFQVLMRPILNSDICPKSHIKLKFVFIKDNFLSLLSFFG